MSDFLLKNQTRLFKSQKANSKNKKCYLLILVELQKLLNLALLWYERVNKQFEAEPIWAG